MKKAIYITFFTALASLAVSCDSVSAQQNGGIIRDDDTPSAVVVPPVPEKINFAGESVPTGNFDTRESLYEECGVTMYMHSRTLNSLRASKRYFAIIEPILAENGIPDDFKYMAMAESSLNPEAYSAARAAGLWQIMSSTAADNKLEVNDYVDERYNIEKATRVACKYIRQARERFGSWTMAAASYNLGMAGLAKRVAVQKTADYYDLWLPAETMRYMFRIISLKLATENPEAYGFRIDDEDYYLPFVTRDITVSGPDIDWVKVARDNGTDYKILRELNPWIREYKHPNKTARSYTVKVPAPGMRTAITR
ncbi:MAG: lytic transglycosylase domain-containing protein [Rikenellaceae bacterium]|nr:lytic transglycosylase domain-containing protein [Rikenellaceae bacterium]